MKQSVRWGRWAQFGLMACAAGCHEASAVDAGRPEAAPGGELSPDGSSVVDGGGIVVEGGWSGAGFGPSGPCANERAVGYYQFYSFRDGVAYPTMRDRIQPGDRIALEFKPTPGCGGKFSLVTYEADGPAGGDLTRQRIYAAQTIDAVDGPVDSYAMGFDTDLRAPPCTFQVDFVRGEPIEQFDPANGVTYGAQGRLIDWDQSEPGPASCGRRFEFSFTRPNDYLFVIDNSESFGAIVNELRDAYNALAPSDFPVDTRVGIISSLPAEDRSHLVPPDYNPLEPRRHHPRVNAYLGIDLEPGFLKPVTRADYDAFMAQPFLPDKIRERYEALAPCTGPFFGPKELTGPGGFPCFTAGSLFAFHPTVVETPLVAYWQTLTRAQTNFGPALFRHDASVHLVILTDTLEPGYPGSGLEEHPGRDGTTLESLTLSSSGGPLAMTRPATFDVSAIAPTEPHHGAYDGRNCVVEPYGDYKLSPFPYQEVIKLVGGELYDICYERGNYAAVMRKIVLHETRAPVRVSLPADVAQILGVKVIDKEVESDTPWEPAPGGGAILLTDLSSRELNKVVIKYEPKALL